MEHFYTDERNAQILISLLKAHCIRKIVASPGTTNICFVASVQHDPYFEIYSAADERSAGYIACGLAAETGEPVVLSCTGATASRNYMPPLTEAFYRKLPVLAVTSSRRGCQIGHNIDQVTDRTLLPRDIAKISVQLPLIFDEGAEWECTIAANKALLELRHRGNGPVHINLETAYSRNYTIAELPAARAIYRYVAGEQLPKLNAQKIAIVVGAHMVWTDGLTNAVDDFCAKNNAIVLCDHTSNYKGKYRVFANLAAQQENFVSVVRSADLVIHIGDISASDYRLITDTVWRVNPDGELRDTFRKLKCVFEMDEEVFFCNYANIGAPQDNLFLNECRKEESGLRTLLQELIPHLPFSNIWAASQASSQLPENAVLHLGIQNSLRSWNFFDVDESIAGYSNTGGFGIDGSLSSTIGASLAHKDKIYFCILGDLAFFYDMNALGNRHINNNLRIMLVNNGKGSEFKLITNPGAMFGDEADAFIAAAGHYGRQSSVLVKHYVEDLGFEYLAASSKEEYLALLEEFTTPIIKEKPIVFEIFTNTADENTALFQIRHMCSGEPDDIKDKLKNAMKGILGEKGVQTVRKIIRK